MEPLVAVAVGLNPYAGTFVLAALAAGTDRVPLSDIGTLVPGALWALVAALYGLAMPADFVLGKFVRFAPRVRYAGHVVAPLSAGLGAVAVQQTDLLPAPFVAAGAALIAWLINAGVTACAARISRSAEYIGLGHIPVLMSAGVAAACIIPLGLAASGLGAGVAGFALLMLGVAQLESPAGRRAQVPARPATRPVAPATSPAPAPAPAPALPVVFAAGRGAGRASGRAIARAYAGAL